jgi:hypothetical protein
LTAIEQRTRLTLQDQFSLRDAQETLIDVQQRIADGTLRGTAAQIALRDAHQKVTDTQQLQAEKQKTTAAEQTQLRHATEAVAKATAEHATAAAKAATAGQETTAQNKAVRDSLQQLQAAQDAYAQAGVAAQQQIAQATHATEVAQRELARAQASGDGGATVAQLQQEEKLRAKVAEATARQEEAQAKLRKANQDVAEFATKVDHIEEEIANKVKGAAAAAAETTKGHLASMLAHAQNFFAKFGTSFGIGLVVAGSALDIFLALSKTKWVVSTASWVATHLLGMGAMATGTEAAAGTMTASMGPWILVIGALAFAAYELYKHWDAVWGFIKRITSDAFNWIKHHLDLIIQVAFGPLGFAVVQLHNHWSQVWGAIVGSAEWVVGRLGAVFSTIGQVALTPFRSVIDVVNSVIRMIDSFEIHWSLPPWLGGGSFDFNGFHIPQVPQFAAGGVVPGPAGAPRLIMAHGGEVVLNDAQQRALSGGGGSGGGGGVVVQIDARGALIPDAQSLDRLGRQLADGVLAGLLTKQSQGYDLRIRDTRIGVGR